MNTSLPFNKSNQAKLDTDVRSTHYEKLIEKREESSELIDIVFVGVLFVFLVGVVIKLSWPLQFISGLPTPSPGTITLAFLVMHRITACLEILIIPAFLILHVRLLFGSGVLLFYSLTSFVVSGAQAVSLIFGFVLSSTCNSGEGAAVNYNPCNDVSYCCNFYNTTQCGNVASPCPAGPVAALSANPLFIQLSWWSFVLLLLQFGLFVLAIVKIKTLTMLHHKDILSIYPDAQRQRSESLRYLGQPINFPNNRTVGAMYGIGQHQQVQPRVPIHTRIANNISKKIDAMGSTRVGTYLDKMLMSFIPHVE